MATTAFLAIDLGAESGRGILGRFDGERLTVEEIHRFPNGAVLLPDGPHWDALRLLAETQVALARARMIAADSLAGIGVDAWGVDFALLDKDGALVGNPGHYRDPRWPAAVERAHARVSPRTLYHLTGCQHLPINTVYQLVALERSPLLEAAERLLMMPDLFTYWLSGQTVGERTIATTTGLFGHRAGDWIRHEIVRLNIPVWLFPPLVSPGTVVGSLLKPIARETGARAELPVLAVAGHDTASAVAAVPAENEDFAYVSSGTWSLVGVELPEPVLTDMAMRANFANEGGLAGRIRFLRNVTGLWLLQECRRTWALGGRDYGYEELAALAEKTPPFGPLIDPNAPLFLPHGDLPSRIFQYCRATGQEPPVTPGEVARCVLESLALAYRSAIEEAERLTGRRVRTIHVVGGGAQNALLNQLTADATGRPVLAGPVEATAIGNLLVQAFALGHLSSPEEIRAVVRRSFVPARFEPRGDNDRWDEGATRLAHLVAGSSDPTNDASTGGHDPA
jgi:rhamnulokinase